MDGQNIPCILPVIVPQGPLPCIQSENLSKEEKQDKGTADHILTLVDYSPRISGLHSLIPPHQYLLLIPLLSSHAIWN